MEIQSTNDAEAVTTDHWKVQFFLTLKNVFLKPGVKVRSFGVPSTSGACVQLNHCFGASQSSAEHAEVDRDHAASKAAVRGASLYLRRLR